MAHLPFVINNIRIGYIFGKQIIHEKALHIKLPDGRVYDDEAHIDLQSGAIIASRILTCVDEDVMTTSEICLQSPSGENFITVTKCGFPGSVDEHSASESRSSTFGGSVQGKACHCPLVEEDIFEP